MGYTRVVPINRRVAVEQSVNLFNCASCGVLYGIGVEFTNERQKDGDEFFCPNGHSLSYASDIKSDVERAEQERDAARSLAARESDRRIAAQAEARRLDYQARAAKGQLTKARKRQAAGVCPCCNRTFANVVRHLEGQHPEFVASQKVTP